MPKSMTRALLALLIFVGLAFGQGTGVLAGTTGGIQGTVTSATGSPVANVQVSAVAPSYSNKTVTGSNGFYALASLPPDTYTVTFTATGFTPVSVFGITVNQDQTVALNHTLTTEVKTLGKQTVRGTTSLVQPKTTVNQYTVTSQSIQNITGTPQNISETAVLNTLPGITTDSAGYPVIRAGAENEEGYELEGIDATDPLTGQFINSLSLVGDSRIVVSTGGYDVSNGNTNAGVINSVIKRGAYPGAGQSTARMNFQNFDHRLAGEWGSATPDNRFSYFMAFNSIRDYRVYGDRTTFLPRLVGAVGDETGNQDVMNLFYRWGENNANEIQYFGETGASLFNENNLINSATTPYASNNGEVLASLGPDIVAATQLFPGQVGLNQFTDYADHENNQHSIQKLNFRRTLTASSYAELRFTRTDEADNFILPWDGGAFGDEFEHNYSANSGIGFDYENQLSSKHQIAFGAETIFTKSAYDLGLPSESAFIFGNELCYVTPINIAFGCPSNEQFLGKMPALTLLVNDPLHRSDLWVKDDWSPSDKIQATIGVRYDQEILDIPANAARYNYSFTTSPVTGAVTQLPGPAITSDVTHPKQVSPRFALSYKLDDNNVLRFSYGKNIEFTPFTNVEAKSAISPSMAQCNIASGCFQPLLGGPGNLVPGQTSPSNNITNLYQQAIGDYNSNFFAQYTPVKPQRATNYDLSFTHEFPNNFELRITPYYRKGVDYVVANTPLLFTLPDGTSIFGSPREQNAGVNQNTGVELALQKNASFGLSGTFSFTYDNTLANYNSDFFPSTNNAALALNHFFHVSYVAPIVATLNLAMDTRNGWHFSALMPFESGYRYGVGKKTFIFQPIGPNGGEKPVEVLNTDLAEIALGANQFTSAYYFTDPSNPGTILHPNITGSRGTDDGNDPGTLIGPPRFFLNNVTVAHDVGHGPTGMQVGIVGTNLLGNYTNTVVGGNSRYRNNGLGGFGPTSGTNLVLPLFEPYQFPRSPNPYENEPTGPARLYTLFVSIKY
ncbi:MAG TPA: TonB-dependent receptor [Candidatus Eremiobacteraceae bacterium]